LPVLIEDHHPAYICFDKYLETQERIKSNPMYQPNASTFKDAEIVPKLRGSP